MSAALKSLRHGDATVTAPEEISLLRFLTFGSVDDGKSTLLGRLLFDSNAVLDDQLTALDRDSRRHGTAGDSLDFALLVDGLSAEREQGITIDVAYRYFATARRTFIVADTPGHEQYTRNMATGASTADLAVLLVDARKGILPQTRRHAYIVSTLGVKHAVLAVNKMDLVDFSLETWTRIVAEFREAAAGLGFVSIVPIPICARHGDNIATRSDRMPLYTGPVLLEHLETVSVETGSDDSAGFQFPVQLVTRPNLDFRGYAGTVASGVIHVNQPVVALPGGQRGHVARIVTQDGDRQTAVAGEAVTITLRDEIDVSRGDVIAARAGAPAATTGLTARLLWMGEQALDPSRSFLVRIGTASVNTRVQTIRHAIDIHSFAARPATTLAMNEIGLVDLAFDRALIATPYVTNRTLGALILIDRMTNQTVALGVVEQAEAPRARRAVEALVERAIIARALTGFALLILVAVLSNDWRLATIVALAEMALAPVIERLTEFPWKSEPEAS